MSRLGRSFSTPVYGRGGLRVPETVTYTASIAGAGSVAPNLVRSQRIVATAIAGTGVVAPNFVRDKRVVATSIAGVGTVSISYLARTRPIAVVVSGVGTVGAVFVRIKLIATAIAGTGTVVTNFVRDKRVFNVVVAGTGAVTAAIVRTRGLAATIAGIGSVVTNFVRDKRVFNVSIAGVGSVVADFTKGGLKELAVTIAGTSSVSAAVSVTRGIATVIAGQGSLAAVYVRNQRVFGTTIGGIGTVVADLTVSAGAGVVAKFRTLMGVGQ